MGSNASRLTSNEIIVLFTSLSLVQSQIQTLIQTEASLPWIDPLLSHQPSFKQKHPYHGLVHYCPRKSAQWTTALITPSLTHSESNTKIFEHWLSVTTAIATQTLDTHNPSETVIKSFEPSLSWSTAMATQSLGTHNPSETDTEIFEHWLSVTTAMATQSLGTHNPSETDTAIEQWLHLLLLVQL